MIAQDESLKAELTYYQPWIQGRVLNAGCGKRYINLGAQSFRLDVNPYFAVAIDVQADVHFLPFANNTFDTVVSIAVLEHTRYAWEVAKEFFRVLKPNGKAVIAIPFMQPAHGVPQDFVRFTEQGIQALMEWANFRVIEVKSTHSVGFNAEWAFREFLAAYPLANKISWPLRRWVFPRMREQLILTKHISAIQSAYYIVAEKS